MMGQGDLDDLVVDRNMGRDNKKGKGILTILALLIAILIIVIMMAKMVMGEKDADKHLVKTEQESLISPELQLDDEDKPEQSDSENLENVSSMINEDNKSEANEIKEDTVEVNEEKIKELVIPKVEVKQEPKQEVLKPKKTEKSKPKSEPSPKPIVHNTKPKPIEQKKPKRVVKEIKIPTAKGSYYIQVGSFANKPSSRFLSVITNSGFNYKLHSSGKLLIGSYSSRSSANKDLPRVKDLINKSAFVISIK